MQDKYLKEEKIRTLISVLKKEPFNYDDFSKLEIELGSIIDIDLLREYFASQSQWLDSLTQLFNCAFHTVHEDGSEVKLKIIKIYQENVINKQLADWKEKQMT